MKAQSWLWPDHVISKRESRKLREEHNAVVNLNAELLDALKMVSTDYEYLLNEKMIPSDVSQIESAIAKAEGK